MCNLTNCYETWPVSTFPDVVWFGGTLGTPWRLFWGSHRCGGPARCGLSVPEHLSKSSQRSGWDLNSGPPNYKSSALTVRRRCSKQRRRRRRRENNGNVEENEEEWGKKKQGWRSGESARLPPMWPGFTSQRRHHMWVKFVVGSFPCSERFFSGFSGFPLSSKTNTSKFQFDLERTDKFKRVHMNSCVLRG